MTFAQQLLHSNTYGNNKMKEGKGISNNIYKQKDIKIKER
jgi:hypothetical protein